MNTIISSDILVLLTHLVELADASIGLATAIVIIRDRGSRSTEVTNRGDPPTEACSDSAREMLKSSRGPTPDNPARHSPFTVDGEEITSPSRSPS